MNRTAKITVGVIGVLVAIGAGLGFVLFEEPQKGTIVAAPEPAPQPPEPAPEPAPEPEVTQTPGPEEPSTDQAEVDETPEPVIPKFDVVRIDVDGSTVVAGQAAPGATVEILLDGNVVATETADGAGQFVSLFSVPVTGEARQLVLRAADGETATELAAAQTAAATEDAVSSEEAPATGEGLEETVEEVVAETVEETVIAAAPQAETEEASPATSAPEATELLGATEQPSTNVVEPTAETTPDPVEASVSDLAETTGQAAEPVAAAQPVEDTVQAPRVVGETQAASAVESAPVLILPSTTEGNAPTVVQPEAEELALLQPAAGEITSVRLDRISYSAGGDVDLLGRATPGNTIRVYSNALLATQTTVVPAGQWRASLPASTGQATKLLRFDEVDPAGKVVSRIETPFSYQVDDGPKTLRERTVEIERGDYLWRIAEQYYGEGLRYSLIFSANAELIKDPDLIYPGQVFTVPELVDGE